MLGCTPPAWVVRWRVFSESWYHNHHRFVFHAHHEWLRSESLSSTNTSGVLPFIVDLVQVFAAVVVHLPAAPFDCY